MNYRILYLYQDFTKNWWETQSWSFTLILGIAHLHLYVPYAPTARTWTATWASHSVSTWLLRRSFWLSNFKVKNKLDWMSSSRWTVSNGNQPELQYTFYNSERISIRYLFWICILQLWTRPRSGHENSSQIANKWHACHIYGMTNQPKAAAFFLESSACTTHQTCSIIRFPSYMGPHPSRKASFQKSMKRAWPATCAKKLSKTFQGVCWHSCAPAFTVSIDFCSSKLRTLGASWLIIYPLETRWDHVSGIWSLPPW